MSPLGITDYHQISPGLQFVVECHVTRIFKYYYLNFHVDIWLTSELYCFVEIANGGYNILV